MRRGSQPLGTLQVKASNGNRSSQAQPTPVVKFVAPGPTVDTHTPGTPVRYPTALAMNPADVSLAVRTNSTELRRSASINGRTGPLGTPKTQRTSASSNARAIKSLLFNERSSSRIGEIGWEDRDPKSSICYSR